MLVYQRVRFTHFDTPSYWESPLDSVVNIKGAFCHGIIWVNQLDKTHPPINHHQQTSVPGDSLLTSIIFRHHKSLLLHSKLSRTNHRFFREANKNQQLIIYADSSLCHWLSPYLWYSNSVVPSRFMLKSQHLFRKMQLLLIRQAALLLAAMVWNARYLDRAMVG